MIHTGVSDPKHLDSSSNSKMEKRYQVFISSTFEDLKQERQAALKAILEMDHMPAGMELFPASDETAWRLICDVIDTSDYYLVIVGGRYGSLDETGIGYTEKEYDYALSLRKPIIPLLHSVPDNLPRGRTETEPAVWQKLKAFRSKVEARHTCAYWQTADELRGQVIIGLTSTIKKHPAQGWIKAGMASAEASQEILELKREIDSQRAEIDRLSSSPPAGTENLAKGSDRLTVDYRVTLSKDNAPWNDNDRIVKVAQSAEVTWDQVFGAFGPTLITPTPESEMKSEISRFLRDLSVTELLRTHPGYSITYGAITEGLFQTIKVQFLALGMISSGVARVLKGKSESDLRVCELTPLGRQHLVKVKAIVRKQSEGGAYKAPSEQVLPSTPMPPTPLAPKPLRAPSARKKRSPSRR
jgi:hypothetical protein